MLFVLLDHYHPLDYFTVCFVTFRSSADLWILVRSLVSMPGSMGVTFGHGFQGPKASKHGPLKWRPFEPLAIQGSKHVKLEAQSNPGESCLSIF